jgi:hypothetical protein
MRTSLEGRLLRLERTNSDEMDVRNMSWEERLARVNAFLAKFLVGPDAPEAEYQTALKRLDIEDEHEMAIAEFWFAVVCDGDPAERVADARNVILKTAAKSEEFKNYWAKATGTDAAHAKQPGFEPAVFSYGCIAQNNTEGFTRRREMRARLVAMAEKCRSDEAAKTG